MFFMNYIVSRLRAISDFLYDIFLEVYSWVYPFYLAADFFYELSWLFYYLANNFADFGDWLDWAADELEDILSWSTIRSYIRNWLPDLEDAIDWWDRWWVWVGREIDDWWTVTWNTVRTWVYARIDDVEWLISSIETSLNTLKAAWDDWKVKIPSFDQVWSWFTNWWGNTLANIIAWGALTALEIDTLINSRIKEWLPFYENIVEFFTDPLGWLESRFITWFLGPEEE